MKTSKKTKEQINHELQEKFPNLEIIGDYIGANEKTLIKCKNCNHEWLAVPRSVKSSKYGCTKCGHLKAYYEKALNYFLNKYNSEKYELIEFESCHKVTVKCKICGTIRTTTADNIYRYGCPNCGLTRGSQAQRLTKEQFIYNAKQIHGDYYDYSKVEVIDYKTKVCIICPKHGEFWQSPHKHYGDRCGCPKCASSHGEKIICRILNDLNINYQYQVKIHNPYNDNNFIIDFKIDDIIIEYNGQQHYTPVEHFGGELRFKQQIQRDNDLKKYCLEHNLRLLEIPYTYSETEIKNKIIEFLGN